jgi:hypothetical protein
MVNTPLPKCTCGAAKAPITSGYEVPFDAVVGSFRAIAANLHQMPIKFSEKMRLIRVEYGQKARCPANPRFKPCC